MHDSTSCSLRKGEVGGRLTNRSNAPFSFCTHSIAWRQASHSGLESAASSAGLMKGTSAPCSRATAAMAASAVEEINAPMVARAVQEVAQFIQVHVVAIRLHVLVDVLPAAPGGRK